MSYSKKDPIKMNKGGKPAMYDMVKKYMFKGGKNPKKKISAQAQAAFDAKKAAEEEAAEKARRDAKKGLTAKGGMKVYKAGGKRPDYPDVDGDGNEKEPMEQALKDAGKAYKGMKIKKAKGGMKLYNNGGKEDPKKLATPEEIKESRRGPQRSRTDEQKKARKEAKKEAKRQARRGAPGTGTGLVKTATTEATGPETLRTGQVRRRGRRLERSAERAGLTKDQAYEVGKAEEALASATESGDKKKAKAANKTIKRQLKYQGQDKKRAIIPVGRKKPAKPGGEEEEKKKKGAIKLRLNRGAKPSSPSTRTNPRRARRPIITRETSGFREHYNRPK
jgi:hypothetical protein